VTQQQKLTDRLHAVAISFYLRSSQHKGSQTLVKKKTELKLALSRNSKYEVTSSECDKIVREGYVGINTVCLDVFIDYYRVIDLWGNPIDR